MEKDNKSALKNKFLTYGLIGLLIIAAFVFGYNLNLKKEYASLIKESVSTGKAKIQITEWSDFQCPFCKRGTDTLNQVVNDLDKENFDVIYKHFPLVSIHQFAWKAAEASECARDQEKFWEMHDMLFQNQNALDIPSLKKYAGDLDLDTAKFNACLDNSETKDVVQTDYDEGQAAGITGTPMFVVKNLATGETKEINGARPIEDFKAVIIPMLS